MGKTKNNSKNLITFADMPKEQRDKVSKEGNKKAQEVRKKKKEYLEQNQTIEDFVKGLLTKTAVGADKELLKEMGYEDGQCINLNVLLNRLYKMGRQGSIKATELLLTLGGFTGDEKRKNSEEERKNLESKARIKMMELNAGKGMDLTSGDDEGSVVIYLPEIEKEEEEKEEEAEAEPSK